MNYCAYLRWVINFWEVAEIERKRLKETKINIRGRGGLSRGKISWRRIRRILSHRYGLIISGRLRRGIENGSTNSSTMDNGKISCANINGSPEKISIKKLIIAVRKEKAKTSKGGKRR